LDNERRGEAAIRVYESHVKTPGSLSLLQILPLTLLLLMGWPVSKSVGQAPVITSFPGNGRVTWTNTVNAKATYRMEWSSRAGGPWHSFTHQPIHTIDAHEQTSFEAEVPMFYRVVMTTNEPPAGMVWIDAGEFVMGDTAGAGNADELPVHTNFISGFWIEEMEVSGAKWAEVFNWAIMNGYTFSPFTEAGATNQEPAQLVSWVEAILWCNARSQKEGLAPCYYSDDTRGTLFTNFTSGDWIFANASVDWSANGYRLPTEAEWEKAARGGRQGRLFPWGDAIQHARANYYATNSHAYDTSPTSGPHPAFGGGSSPVGSFAANGYSLHDMAGNVWEWCWDRHAAYSGDNQTDPRGPKTGGAVEDRVLRGGSYSETAFHQRCAVRKGEFVGVAYSDYGFRCVRR
jgi:formylglycine-generating enzyme required for sulfatase activity